MKKLNVGDKVIILSGKDKGKTGEVKKLNWKSSYAIVDGVNMVTKALKPTQENPNGGFGKVENKIHLSNLSLVSPKTGKATRVGIKIIEGKKSRYAKACGSTL